MFAGLKSIASRMRSFLGQRKNRSAPKKKLTHRRLELESLEGRLCPADFGWVGPANGLWEDWRNWGGTIQPNDYPGFNGTNPTTNDTALLGNQNTVCIMQNAHELAQLQITAGHTAVLEVRGNLTLNNGGYMDNGTIIQKTATFNGAIILTGGTFTWANGDINYSATTATLVGSIQINNAANMVFNQGGQAASNLGSDVTITGGATLTLSNLRTVTLRNRPVITNTSGHINITASNLFGLVVPDGDVAQTIINNGSIEMNGGPTATYGIDNPVANHNNLRVISGTLQFKRADQTTGYSVNTDAVVTIDPGGNTLKGDNGIWVTAGSFYAGGGSRIDTPSNNFKITGGVVYIGSEQNTGFVTATGNVVFQAGTMTFYCNTAGNTAVYSRLLCLGSTGITITKAATTADVIFFGGGDLAQNTELDVMRCTNINGVVSDTCQGKPVGWTPSVATFAHANDTYRLKKD